MKIGILRLTNTAKLPLRMTEHASGFDIFADIPETIIVEPGKYLAIPTGFALEIPPGFEAQIRPRSGLALKQGIGILNSPGTIDADYRGEIKAIIINLNKEQVSIEPGTRIAQMVFCPVIIPDLQEMDSLNSSSRQDGGFGHTGH